MSQGSTTSALGRALNRSLNLKTGRLHKLKPSKDFVRVEDAYKELLKIYDKIAGRLRPEWNALQIRFDALTQEMRRLETTKVDNSASARDSHRKLVEAQIEVARELLLAVEVEEAGAAGLEGLLTADDERAEQLLKKPEMIQGIVDSMPNTSATVDTIERIERRLLQLSGEVQQGTAHQAYLTPAVHDVLFRRKTEVYEHLLADKLARSTNPRLAELKQLPKDEYWKILMDGRAHQHGNKHFYDRSKGYMASMMRGLETIVDNVDTPLSTDFVKTLHTGATEFVTTEMGDTFIIGPTNMQEHGVKTAPNSWGVCRDFSREGMDELATLRTELDQVVGGNFFADDATKFEGVNETCQWRAGGTRTGAALQQDVETLMDYVINKCYGELQAASQSTTLTDTERRRAKLGAIIDCCRGLGIIHPFKDANGRLMMFLVLNKLLTENGFPPTILDDQGHMVGKSRDELITEVENGQQRVQALYGG
jgi:hypothetical protein